MAGITAKDIAEKLGISTASVSVALNGKPGVSQATREKILAVAASMGYSLPKASSGDGRLVCFLLYADPAVAVAQESSFSTFVLKGVEDTAKELGYRVLIRYAYAGRDLAAQLEDILDDLAGLLILGTDLTATRRSQLASLPLPAVVVDNFLFSGYVDCVGNDNLFGAKSAVSYLIDRGHRSFGYLRARQRTANFDDREAGVHLALQEHLPGAALTVVDVDIAADRAYEDLRRWLESQPDLPDALFAENDVVAAAAIRALRAAGIAVPEAVSVMGFDDIPICELVEPTLTTVHSFKETLGREAVGLLHRRITQGFSPAQVQAAGAIKLSLSTRIVPRDSVAQRPVRPN